MYTKPTSRGQDDASPYTELSVFERVVGQGRFQGYIYIYYTELFLYEHVAGPGKAEVSGNCYSELFVYERVGNCQGKVEVSGNCTELFAYEYVDGQGTVEVLGLCNYYYAQSCSSMNMWIVKVLWRFLEL